MSAGSVPCVRLWEGKYASNPSIFNGIKKISNISLLIF